MRIVRVITEGDCRYGLADDATITLISDEPFGQWEPEGAIHLRGAELLTPVVPTKIVCVGINYRSHAEEMGLPIPVEPVIFLKPPTALNSPGGDIRLPPGVGRVDFEAELAAVIGRRTRNATAEQARMNILGYMCANDVTARDLQQRDGQWTRAKGYDGFCPLGPWVETDVEPEDLLVECYVNGKRRQSGCTSDLIFSVPEAVSFISGVMTLVPGDVVLTGTPGGIGELRPGDSVEVRIEGIGSLFNPVV
ncbi:MAG: fumarylacetoacetate hydrolase family protein [Coriobacteriia bacterium]|jgi:2-keto-4-pentenoate hydratase/2-oxohepta-3-ene-1,7-dioic acid hydratase in catechol pathway|nr:fumarylacetoacetate hydrolase family protein [Coriobacteriia bacterium]